jgi:hypothetical protein
MSKLPLDGRQIRKNIRMIEFQIIQNHTARAIVQELGALIEERRVVFVGFDNEKRRLAEPCAHPEIAGHATDQEAGCHTRLVQNPGQHRTGGGFAMRAGDAQHELVAKNFLAQPLRTGTVTEKAGKQLVDDRHIPAHDIADNDFGILRQRGIHVRLHGNTSLRQLITHRRVDGMIAAGHVVAHAFGQLCERSHECACNAQNMYFFQT